MSGSWQRPKTTRRYLHPPKAERMYTLWAEGKIILGEIIEGVDWRSYKELDCSGVWLLHGDDPAMFDPKQSETVVTDDGTPIHALRLPLGGGAVEMEAFCDEGRRPTCFLRVTVRNDGDSPMKETLCFLVRSGKEAELVFASPDEYASYAPDADVWKKAPSTWQADPIPRDGDVFLKVDPPFETAWDAEIGALRVRVEIAPHASASLHAAFGKGEARAFDYEAEKRKTRAMWRRELGRLTKLPRGITDDPALLKMVRHLTAQILQCFCYPVGKPYLLARQGGLQRLIWPWESVSVLEALGKLGDFADYIEPVLRLYFDHLQQPDGEIHPMGEGWACITAACLGSFARYCEDASPSFYARYRDAAFRAFGWVRSTRASSAAMEGCCAGLFPPKRGCDWGEVFQSWTNTDIFNLEGLRAYARAAERFKDPAAAEIRAEYEDYMARMREYFYRLPQTGDTMRIPLTPDGNDRALMEGFYPNIHHGAFVYSGVVREEDVERVRRGLVAEGLYQNGLYGRMPYKDGNMHIWYTTFSDYYWFRTFMRMGDRQRAKETLDAQIRYSMSEEYAMIERYADNDPYFVPWSPNASANGRLLLMLARYYGAEN